MRGRDRRGDRRRGGGGGGGSGGGEEGGGGRAASGAGSGGARAPERGSSGHVDARRAGGEASGTACTPRAWRILLAGPGGGPAAGGGTERAETRDAAGGRAGAGAPPRPRRDEALDQGEPGVETTECRPRARRARRISCWCKGAGRGGGTTPARARAAGSNVCWREWTAAAHGARDAERTCLEGQGLDAYRRTGCDALSARSSSRP